MLFRAYSRQSEPREEAGLGTMLLPAYSGQNDERYFGLARARPLFCSATIFPFCSAAIFGACVRRLDLRSGAN